MDTTKVILEEYFGLFGEIAKIVIPFNSSQEKSLFKGYSLITFKDEETIRRVLVNKTHIILKRKVHCRLALSKREARENTAEKSKKKLFIGGLSQKTSEDSLIEYFSKFGQVEDAYLIYDKNSTNSRCFGFVEFKQRETAIYVNDLKHSINGKDIVTKFQLLKNKKGTREEMSDCDSAKQDAYQGVPEYQNQDYDYDCNNDYGYGYSYDYNQPNQVPYQAEEQYYYQDQQPQYQQQAPMNDYQQPNYGYYDQNYNNNFGGYYDQSYNNQQYYYQDQQPAQYQYQNQQYQYQDQQPQYQYPEQQQFDFDYNGEYYEINGYNNYQAHQNGSEDVSPKHQSFTQSTEGGFSNSNEVEIVGSQRTLMKYCAPQPSNFVDNQALSSN